MAVPYSRLLLGIVPWYSVLIVLGAALAIFLATRQESRVGLPKDTVIDFSLWALPCGIIGARLYYVLFSFSQFQHNLSAVFRIWEGGIAIYGGIIAGMLTAVIFCRVKRIALLPLCDILAPGLVLAQAIGRWGNYFNQEAYGWPVSDPGLCFFPFAVLIQSSAGESWHLATFFYESCWNFCIFLFLLIARKKYFRQKGDAFFFYIFLYACGRLVIEELRMDSLYASSVRVSQLLSIVLCVVLLVYYFIRFHKADSGRRMIAFILLFITLSFNLFLLLSITILTVDFPSIARLGLLVIAAIVNIVCLFTVYSLSAKGDIAYADVQK